MPSRRSTVIVFLLVLVIGLRIGSADRLLFTTALIWAMLALSAWFLLRISGRSSLGNASFFGVAAYVVGVSSTLWDIDNIWIVLAIALSASALVGLLVGLVSGRLSGFHFLLITLAFAEMFRSLATRWKRLGGEDGMAGIGRPSAWPIPLDLADATTMMWFTFMALILTVAMLAIVVRSPFGAAVVATRDSESRMATLGYVPAAQRVAAVVVASVVAGLAGALNAYAIRFVSPAEFVPLVSAKALLFAVIGGAGMLGSVVAAVVMTFLEDELSARLDRWTTVLGVVYLLIAMFGDLPKRWFGRLRSRTASIDDAGSPPDRAPDTQNEADSSGTAAPRAPAELPSGGAS